MTVAVAPQHERSIGKLERLAYERAERDHERWPARSFGDCAPGDFWFDEEAAERVIIFHEEYCRHWKGKMAGMPLVLSEWQRFQIRQVFGWKRGPAEDPDDPEQVEAQGTRRFVVWWEEVARKNGKSTSGGAVGLYLLLADGEEGAEVYSVATKKDQAKIIWKSAKQMVKKSPLLLEHITPMAHNLHVEQTASLFEALGSDKDTLDGLNPHGILVDEIHAHKERGLWDVLVSATGSREQPLIAVKTTAGVYDPEQIGWELHDYSCKVLEGILVDEEWFAFICAADDDVAWDSDEAIEQGNPNLGISVRMGQVRRERRQAIAQPNKRGGYERYHLNRWTATRRLWLKTEDWRKTESIPRRSLFALRGQSCWAGADLSTKLDLTSVCFAFLRHDFRPYKIELLSRHYMPEERLDEAEREDRAPYRRWVEEGWMRATPGNVIDYGYIERDVLRLVGGDYQAEPNSEPETFRPKVALEEMAYDPYNATGFANTMEQTHGLEMVLMRQGYASMSEPTKEFEALVVSHRIIHGNDPVLRWTANNVVTVMDPAGNIKPDKKASRKRIDPIVAAIMAVGRLEQAVREGGSVYDKRGIITIGG